jgi:hypothetical protein
MHALGTTILYKEERREEERREEERREKRENKRDMDRIYHDGIRWQKSDTTMVSDGLPDLIP